MYSNLGRFLDFPPPPPKTTPAPLPVEEMYETFVQSKPQREDGCSQLHCIQLKRKIDLKLVFQN